MKNRNRRKFRKNFIILALIIVLLLGCFLLKASSTFFGPKSIHESAAVLKESSCRAFYPKGSSKAKEYVSELCKSADKGSVFDYVAVKYGDYQRIDYGQGKVFYIDEDNRDLKVDSFSDEGRKLVSDYLRYQYKKAEIDEAYTSAFALKSYYENLKLENAEYEVEGNDLLVKLADFDEPVAIPLKYASAYAGIDLGFGDIEYIRPHYVSDKRKIISFTFDDGPNIASANPTSRKMIEELYKYDCSSTFFLIGYSLNQRAIDFTKEGVALGMEYGSHTQSHKYLTSLTAEEVKQEIMTPYNDLHDSYGYKMRFYRPPYGSRNSAVDGAAPLTAVLWNVDSTDWSYRQSRDHDSAVSLIKQKVIEDTDNYDVVLFHDIYSASVDAAGELLPYFLDQGYQVVCVSELMDSLGIYEATAFSGK